MDRASKRFQSIDLSFGLSVAPTFGQYVSDGIDIASQSAGEPLYGVHYGAMRVTKSTFESLSVFASKNAWEAHRQLTHRDEIRRRPFQRVDLRCLIGCQQRARLHAERGGYDWPLRNQRCYVNEAWSRRVRIRLDLRNPGIHDVQT